MTTAIIIFCAALAFVGAMIAAKRRVARDEQARQRTRQRQSVLRWAAVAKSNPAQRLCWGPDNGVTLVYDSNQVGMGGGHRIAIKHLESALGRPPRHRVISAEEPPSRMLRLLDAFKWFCSKENQEIIKVVRADLTRDVRSMGEQGRGAWFIRAVLFRHVVCGTVVPIMWDCGMCVLNKVVKAADLVRRLR